MQKPQLPSAGWWEKKGRECRGINLSVTTCFLHFYVNHTCSKSFFIASSHTYSAILISYLHRKKCGCEKEMWQIETLHIQFYDLLSLSKCEMCFQLFNYTIHQGLIMTDDGFVDELYKFEADFTLNSSPERVVASADFCFGQKFTMRVESLKKARVMTWIIDEKFVKAF